MEVSRFHQRNKFHFVDMVLGYNFLTKNDTDIGLTSLCFSRRDNSKHVLGYPEMSILHFTSTQFFFKVWSVGPLR